MATEKRLTREQVLTLIKESAHLDFALDIPEEFKADHDVVLAAVKNCAISTTVLPASLRQDRAFMLQFARRRGYMFEDLPAAFLDDGDFMAELVGAHPEAYEYASERARGRKDMALVAVAGPARNMLRHVPDPLRRDREVLRAALGGHKQAFCGVPEDLRSDPELVALALAHCEGDSSVLECMPEWVREDRSIALRLVVQDASGLAHFSTQVRDDKEVVLAAVQRSDGAVEYASDRLRADRDVALAVVAHEYCDRAFSYLAPELQDDAELVTLAVANHCGLGVLPDRWRDDEATVRKAVSIDAWNYRWASPRLRAMRKIALKAARGSRFPFEHVPKTLREDAELAETAVRSNAENARHLPASLLADAAFLRRIVQHSFDVIQFLPPEAAHVVDVVTIESPPHRSVRIVAETSPDAGYVSNLARVLDLVRVERNGATTLSIRKLRVLTWEPDGPIGSYLSVRCMSQVVALGSFLFFVEENSGHHTFTSLGGYNYQGPKVSDDVLDHRVHLLHEPTGEVDADRLLQMATQVYRGRPDRLPRGVQLFDSFDGYDSALSLLNQASADSWGHFVRSGPRSVQRAPTPVEECLGAARVFVDGHGWRWLIPHEAGSRAALARLEATGDADDWAWIRSRLAEVDAETRALVARHFEQEPFAAEVRAACGA